MCIKDINISNTGGRVDLKVTFSQQNTLNKQTKNQFETQCGLKWNQPVSNLVSQCPVYNKLLEASVVTTDFIKVEI